MLDLAAHKSSEAMYKKQTVIVHSHLSTEG